MIKHLKNQKGLTLVELTAVFVITALITYGIVNFFLFFTNTYEATTRNYDAQFETQAILNEMTRIGMESRGISHVDNGSGLDTSDNIIGGELLNPRVIVFRVDNTGTDQFHIYSYDGSSITYGITDDITDYELFPLADGVTNFTITSIPLNATNYSRVGAINVRIIVNKNGNPIDVTTTINFRNFQ